MIDLAPPTTAAERLVVRALTIGRRTALGVLGDREAAADVAQDVALTALEKAGSRSAGARRVAAPRRRPARAPGGPPQPRTAATPSRAPTATADDPARGVLELLPGLPPRQRAALTLRYVHDLPDTAIAKALGCRTGTVRRCSRAAQALRRPEP